VKEDALAYLVKIENFLYYTSALMALIENEAGAGRVEHLLRGEQVYTSVTL
jgi:PIN domain nuclease of toxin-antitoxin system